MNHQGRGAASLEELLDTAIAEFCRRVDRGEVVDRPRFLAEHAEIAAELRDYFEVADLIEHMAGPTALGDRDRTIALADGDPVLAGADDEAPTLPKQFGRYRILRRLGAGGMGVVYLAEDVDLARLVALKVPRPSESRDEELLARFSREARASAALRHPGICPIYDIGERDGVRYFIMPFLTGRTLAECLRQGEFREPAEIVALLRQLADALETAHRQGVVHRDLKPANIMIGAERRPIIMDFGLARRLDLSEDEQLTARGQLIGSPAYMAPEQVDGAIGFIGPATDIHSLGVICYELLTRRRPFDGSAASMLGQIVTVDPPAPRDINPQIDSRLEAVCLKMLSKRPQDRYQSMAEAAEALERAIAPPAVPAVRSGAGFRRGGAALALLGGLAGVVWLATVILKIETADGILTVESAAEDVQLVVERGGKTVQIIDPRRQRSYRLEPGKYQVRLQEERDGLVLETPEFVLKQNQREVVRVKYEPKRSVAPANATDRAAATWVLSQGGRVHVRELGQANLSEARPGGNLPETSFRLVRVEFSGQRQISDEDLARFKDLPALEDLRLEGANVRGRGLQLLGDVKSLRHLSLPGTPFGDQDVDNLAAVPQLSELWLGDTVLTDIGLDRLCRLLPDLIYLRLERAKVSGAGLKHLQLLTRLQNLVLTGVSLNDDDVKPLARLPALLWLDLRSTPATDRALDELTHLQSLRGLAVHQTGVTADGVRRFSAVRPECKIYFEENRGPF